MRTATARKPMIVIQTAHAFGSNRLMVANQNADAFGPSYTVARMKMKTKPRSLVVAMTWMTAASRHNSIIDLLLLGFLDLLFLKCSSRVVMRMGRCQDRSVGRNQRSLFWSSNTLPDWRIS